MKYLLAGICVLAVTASASAQQPMPQGMNKEQMQNLMQAGQMMQECMAEVQGPMEQLQLQGQKMQAEVRALCKSGKRDEAQETAMKYSEEMAGSKDMQAMKKCGEMATSAMQGMPMMQSTKQTGDGKTTHVCDSVK